MSEEKFDLNDSETRKSINRLITDSAKQLQTSYRENGRNIVVVKNTMIINSAIELASETVKYHGIEDNKVSNCKRFAHVCFWLVKLHPVTFVRPKDISVLLRAFASKYAWIPDDIIDIADESESPSDHKLNQIVALYTFATLVCDNFHEQKSVAEKKVAEFMQSGAAVEVIRSMQFHNYSARTMAMFLESLVQEKIL